MYLPLIFRLVFVVVVVVVAPLTVLTVVVVVVVLAVVVVVVVVVARDYPCLIGYCDLVLDEKIIFLFFKKHIVRSK
jgi:hypothetical protein